MQSIDRAMTVANALATHTTGNGISISDLSKKCELPLSTMHRLLKSMIKQGMVEQDERTKCYRLGTIWLEYGLQVYDSMDYVNKIRPELERLSREVDESVYLSRPAGSEAIIMERIDSENNTIRIYDQLGLRIPMHIGAANKAMLANMSSSKSDAILQKLLPVEQLEPIKITLKQIKKQGYATSHGERTEGTSSVAVAVVDGIGEVVGAISIGVVSFSLTDNRLDFLIEKAIETGKRVSDKLGSNSN
ncbi:IclR family transcriptional regulator [Sporosarcina sp. JAI121]|uniref:IclR family transcriptional regulator n=1 Tax=Sporosarcina sp. JAI121 TaxID=2723064 RepID=UPI0015C9DDE4|nr:IclR family transcriptional regulator [Sporosarcina sp. JAI121]NYF23304.1 DNA-binding IclR family transcriptional regulator [Sporosarcina sp. JAI121]